MFTVVAVIWFSHHNHALCGMMVMVAVRHHCCADDRASRGADDRTGSPTEFSTHHRANSATDTGTNSRLNSFFISRECS